MAEMRKKFDTGFKLEVAKMIKDQGLSVAEVCRSIGIMCCAT